MLRVDRVESREVAREGALGGDAEISLDPYGCVPEVDQLRALQEDPVYDHDELRRSADAHHMRTEPLDVEPIEVVALG